TIFSRDWSSDVCSSDLIYQPGGGAHQCSSIIDDHVYRNIADITTHGAFVLEAADKVSLRNKVCDLGDDAASEIYTAFGPQGQRFITCNATEDIAEGC